MRVLSWNANGRVKAAARRQIQAVLRREPDVIALQEVTRGSYGEWCRGLTEAGYSVISTVDLVALPYPEPPYPSPPFPEWKEPHDHIQRKNFNLIASRLALAAMPGLSFPEADEARYAFPEKHLVARVRVDDGEIDVHNTHLPPGASRGVLKVHHFEAVRRRVDEDTRRPRVLCGDFNAPWSEDENGPVIGPGWGWPQEILKRWNEAEERLLANPEMRDVYREIHDSDGAYPASHFTGRGDARTPHRYDFIFASEELRTETCEYRTDWIERDADRRRLSDHAAVVADLDQAQ
jgi:endonuclease/exonuclease/phosphatase family metal-dependent hydrolase